MEKILNAKNACEALSISKPTLYRLTRSGYVKKIAISQGRVGWLQSSISAYINEKLDEAQKGPQCSKNTHLHNENLVLLDERLKAET